MRKIKNTFKTSIVAELGVPKYEPQWAKIDRLQVRRTVTQMFLTGEYANIMEAAAPVFAAFNSEVSFIHPYLPCLTRGYTLKDYQEDIKIPENSMLLQCPKNEFITRVLNRIKMGGSVDSLLYAQLIKPDLKFDTSTVDMLDTTTVSKMQVARASAYRPNFSPITRPISTALTALRPIAENANIEMALDNLIGTSDTSELDIEELSINILYLKDSIDTLVQEQRTTQGLLAQLLANANLTQADRQKIESPTILQPVKIGHRKQRLLVVGMWPRQFESLRLSFTADFFDHLDIDYVASDKIRKHTLESSGGYDHVLVNTAAINHVIEAMIRANCDDYIRYTGGVSALRSLLIGKANSGEFGGYVRNNIQNWAN